MESNAKIMQYEGSSTNESILTYQKIIGSLLFISRTTRSDISYSVNKLSRFSNNPGEEHLLHANRILEYLNSTLNFALHCYENYNFELTCYVDADWGGNYEDRTSTSGHIIFLGKNIINWNSKKQQCIALSIMEAEYIALAEAIKEVIFIYELIKEIKIKITKPTIFCDNKATLQIAKNPKEYQKAKHIDLKYHFTRKLVEEEKIILEYIESKKNNADIFTKALAKNHFHNNCQEIGLNSN